MSRAPWSWARAPTKPSAPCTGGGGEARGARGGGGARADEAQRALYGVVQEAQRRAREGVRAGMTGREADALAREVIETRGFGAAFGHSTGHGLGLDVHEAPRLARTANDPLPGGRFEGAHSELPAPPL